MRFGIRVEDKLFVGLNFNIWQFSVLCDYYHILCNIMWLLATYFFIVLENKVKIKNKEKLLLLTKIVNSLLSNIILL